MKVTLEHINISFSNDEDWSDIIGLIFGYDEEARKFFRIVREHPMMNLGAWIDSKEATLTEYNESGFKGTGYISYPAEIRKLADKEISKRDITDAINDRRIQTTSFPRESKGGSEYEFEIVPSRIATAPISEESRAKLMILVRDVLGCSSTLKITKKKYADFSENFK